MLVPIFTFYCPRKWYTTLYIYEGDILYTQTPVHWALILVTAINRPVTVLPDQAQNFDYTQQYFLCKNSFLSI